MTKMVTNKNHDSVYEAQAEARCSMGVGCGTSGLCYAAENGKPERCPQKSEFITGLDSELTFADMAGR